MRVINERELLAFYIWNWMCNVIEAEPLDINNLLGDYRRLTMQQRSELIDKMDKSDWYL
jgi:hypothetical protein